MKRPDLYRERPESWLGLLYKLARFRILDRRTARSRVASLESSSSWRAMRRSKRRVRASPSPPLMRTQDMRLLRSMARSGARSRSSEPCSASVTAPGVLRGRSSARC